MEEFYIIDKSTADKINKKEFDGQGGLIHCVEDTDGNFVVNARCIDFYIDQNDKDKIKADIDKIKADKANDKKTLSEIESKKIKID